MERIIPQMNVDFVNSFKTTILAKIYGANFSVSVK